MVCTPTRVCALVICVALIVYLLSKIGPDGANSVAAMQQARGRVYSISLDHLPPSCTVAVRKFVEEYSAYQPDMATVRSLFKKNERVLAIICKDTKAPLDSKGKRYYSLVEALGNSMFHVPDSIGRLIMARMPESTWSRLQNFWVPS